MNEQVEFQGMSMEEPEFFFMPSIAEPTGAAFGDTPLQDFWGTGAGFYLKGGKNAKGVAWQRVYFRWIIEDPSDILASTDPYPHPSAEFSIFYSDPERTARRVPGQGTNDWEVFGESIRRLYGEQAGTALVDMFGEQVANENVQATTTGKRMHLKRVPSLLRVGPNAEAQAEALKAGDGVKAALLGKWHDELVPTWQVLTVEGVGSSEVGSSNGTTGAPVNNLLQHVLDMAHGKDEDSFYAAAMDDEQVMANPSLVAELTQRAFLKTAETSKLITIDPVTKIITKVG